MRKILVSECLYGDRIVRYDAKVKEERHPQFLKWKEEGRLVPICPEVFGGLDTPRPDAQRVGERIINRIGEDVTAEFRKGAEEALRLARTEDVLFCIMKERSPSCGSREIYDGSFTGEMTSGRGLAAEMLIDAGFKVFTEGDIEEAQAYLASQEKDQ